ncbi:hypothetical protein MIR68_004732 [Amoeboaphelidium protococcarum]|nr:hypothetical protein MIR68_004732 [Amoeboaphelidium protococcarum]
MKVLPVIFILGIIVLIAGAMDSQARCDNAYCSQVEKLQSAQYLDDLTISAITSNFGRPIPRQTENNERYLTRVKKYCKYLSYFQRASKQIRQSLINHDEVEWCKNFRHKAILLDNLRPVLRLGYDFYLMFGQKFEFVESHLRDDALLLEYVRLLDQYHHQSNNNFDLQVTYHGVCQDNRIQLKALIYQLPYAPIDVSCLDYIAISDRFQLIYRPTRVITQSPKTWQKLLLQLNQQYSSRLNEMLEQEQDLERDFGQGRHQVFNVRHQIKLELDLTDSNLFTQKRLKFELDRSLQSVVQNRVIYLNILLPTTISIEQMQDIAEFVISCNLKQESAVRLGFSNVNGGVGLSLDQINQLYYAFYVKIPAFIFLQLAVNWHISLPNAADYFAQQELTQMLFASVQAPEVWTPITSRVECFNFAVLLNNLPQRLTQFSDTFARNKLDARRVDYMYDLSIEVDEDSQNYYPECLVYSLLPALKSVPIRTVKIFSYDALERLPDLIEINQKLSEIDKAKTVVELYESQVSREKSLRRDFSLIAANNENVGNLL